MHEIHNFWKILFLLLHQQYSKVFGTVIHGPQSDKKDITANFDISFVTFIYNISESVFSNF